MEDQELTSYDMEIVAVDNSRVIVNIDQRSLEELVSNYNTPKAPRDKFESGQVIDLHNRLKRLKALDRFIGAAEEVNRVLEETSEDS